MTKSQFDSYAWRKGDRVIISETEYKVLAVDFDDNDIYIQHLDGSYEWVSYAVVDLVNTEVE